jgi:hypothetical protein
MSSTVPSKRYSHLYLLHLQQRSLINSVLYITVLTEYINYLIYPFLLHLVSRTAIEIAVLIIIQ